MTLYNSPERCITKRPGGQQCILEEGHSGSHQYSSEISIKVDDTVEIKESLS